MPPNKNRISNLATGILLALAGVADALTLIPFVGDFVGPIFWVLASVYFWKAGLGLLNGKRLATTVISTVAELIPVAQALPTIFVGILAITMMTRFEDKTGITVPGTHMGAKANVAGVRQPPPRIHTNEGGVRPPNGGLTT